MSKKDYLTLSYETGNYTKYSDYFLEQKIKYLQKYTQKDLLKNTRGLKL